MTFNCDIVLLLMYTYRGMYVFRGWGGGGGGWGVKISIQILLYEIANFQIDCLCVPYI